MNYKQLSIRNQKNKNFFLFLKISFLVFLFLVLFSPIYHPLFLRFTLPDSYYSHGFLVPFVFVYLILRKKNEFKKIKYSPCLGGLFILGGGILLHFLGVTLKVNFFSYLALPIVILGTALYWGGKELTKKLLFPTVFLLFMLPLPQVVIIGLAFKLKVFVAQIATFVVSKFFHIEAVREGSTIYYPGGYLVVGDPCSGLRSLITFLALGSLFSYFLPSSRMKKLIVFFSSIPVALLSNIFRIIFLLLISYVYGEKVALGFLHQFSAFIVFALGFFCLMMISNRLKEGELAI
ncbi:MAG: hypothetical protein B6D56_06350 [Candidatus Omnitrophica bacterium 4484_70.1]|nr:MAG: hypothetical protein B6D56_06350 [Candidatus Omnitrophica bacterium 4484_70.1]